jgi:hypothetical protein
LGKTSISYIHSIPVHRGRIERGGWRKKKKRWYKEYTTIQEGSLIVG